MRRRLIAGSLFLLLPTLLIAQRLLIAPEAPGDASRAGQRGPANQPAPRDDDRHRGFLEIARRGNIDLLFVGDSITDRFSNPPYATGLAVWDAAFGPFKPANFGIAGDTTQGVLWRMQNGELDGFKAKLIVLMVGTNNLPRNPVDEIVDGNRLIVEELKKRQPQASVLLLGLFPRNADPAHPRRAKIKEINSKLATLADDERVFYMDIGDKFLAADGTLTTEIMPDGTHPSAKGYQIWADAIVEKVATLAK